MAPRESMRAASMRMMDNTLCGAEHKASLKCIMDHNGDKEPCESFFAAYKACLHRQKRERMRANAGRNMAGIIVDPAAAAAANGKR